MLTEREKDRLLWICEGILLKLGSQEQACKEDDT